MGFQAFIFSFVGVVARTYAKHVRHPLDDHKKIFHVVLFAFLKFLLQHGVEGHFLRTQVEGKKPNNKGSKQVTKPSGPSDRNDGSQVYEITKWALKR